MTNKKELPVDLELLSGEKLEVPYYNDSITLSVDLTEELGGKIEVNTIHAVTELFNKEISKMKSELLESVRILETAKDNVMQKLEGLYATLSRVSMFVSKASRDNVEKNHPEFIAELEKDVSQRKELAQNELKEKASGINVPAGELPK